MLHNAKKNAVSCSFANKKAKNERKVKIRKGEGEW